MGQYSPRTIGRTLSQAAQSEGGVMPNAVRWSGKLLLWLAASLIVAYLVPYTHAWAGFAVGSLFGVIASEMFAER